MTKNQILSRLRAKEHITEEEYQLLKEDRPKGDLISRSALKEVINYNQMYVNPKLAVDDVIKLIDNAPTVPLPDFYERINKETTFDDFLKEQLKDPEFKKEWEKLCDEDMRGKNSGN